MILTPKIKIKKHRDVSKSNGKDKKGFIKIDFCLFFHLRRSDLPGNIL